MGRGKATEVEALTLGETMSRLGISWRHVLSLAYGGMLVPTPAGTITLASILRYEHDREMAREKEGAR